MGAAQPRAARCAASFDDDRASWTIPGCRSHRRVQRHGRQLGVDELDLAVLADSKHGRGLLDADRVPLAQIAVDRQGAQRLAGAARGGGQHLSCEARANTHMAAIAPLPASRRAGSAVDSRPAATQSAGTASFAAWRCATMAPQPRAMAVTITAMSSRAGRAWVSRAPALPRVATASS